MNFDSSSRHLRTTSNNNSFPDPLPLAAFMPQFSYITELLSLTGTWRWRGTGATELRQTETQQKVQTRWKKSIGQVTCPNCSWVPSFCRLLGFSWKNRHTCYSEIRSIWTLTYAVIKSDHCTVVSGEPPLGVASTTTFIVVGSCVQNLMLCAAVRCSL